LEDGTGSTTTPEHAVRKRLSKKGAAVFISTSKKIKEHKGTVEEL
jgi:hypothetical protein